MGFEDWHSMTPYDPSCHHRHSIRLPGYDYAQPGAYFVTICTDARVCSFGEVADGQMRLNGWGRMMADWRPNYYEHVVWNVPELIAIRKYIRDNPAKWNVDRDNVANGHPEAITAEDYLREVKE